MRLIEAAAVFLLVLWPAAPAQAHDIEPGADLRVTQTFSAGEVTLVGRAPRVPSRSRSIPKARIGHAMPSVATVQIGSDRFVAVENLLTMDVLCGNAFGLGITRYETGKPGRKIRLGGNVRPAWAALGTAARSARRANRLRRVTDAVPTLLSQMTEAAGRAISLLFPAVHSGSEPSIGWQRLPVIDSVCAAAQLVQANAGTMCRTHGWVVSTIASTGPRE
ncbi:hypothetical protein [Nocardia pneumoniae]|uniref:hypothetical protein n=1 Tax=Nocardia pneumoniae TaxID=228601 RepID=UPI0005936B02|nr:hypothetical protein [Nocardia pneumoniae]